MNDEHAHRDGKFWVGFFIGGLLGAIILFFLGTKEGKKTGKLLEDKGKDLFDELESRLLELEEKGRELARQGQAIKDDVLNHLENTKEEFTDRASEKLDSALTHIEKLQEEGLESTKTLRKRIFKNLPKKA